MDKLNIKLGVRPYKYDDINKIVGYFVNSDEAYLLGMGADPSKLPSRGEWTARLKAEYERPPRDRTYFYLIWETNGRAIGHCNINKIVFGDHAYLHLHIWDSQFRKLGLGSQLLKQSIPKLFEHSELQTLYCEPMANNEGPNVTLRKLGFDFEKRYKTTPGWINLEQTVNRYKLSKEKLTNLVNGVW